MSKTLSFKSELKRKIIHLMSLFFPVFYYYTENNVAFIYLICIIALITLAFDLLRLNYNYFKILHIFFLGNVVRVYEKKNLYSATYLILSFASISIIFDKHVAITAMMITAIADSFAAIVGLRYGDILLFNNKTLQGTFTFFTATFIILVLFTVNSSFYYLLLCSLFFTLIELFTKTEYDNITVPFFSALIINLGMLI